MKKIQKKINTNFDDSRMNYLKNKNLNQIKLSQKLATKCFQQKKYSLQKLYNTEKRRKNFR